jgi:hypothetical protein
MIVCRTIFQNEFETMPYFTRVIKVDYVRFEPTTSAHTTSTHASRVRCQMKVFFLDNSKKLAFLCVFDGATTPPSVVLPPRYYIHLREYYNFLLYFKLVLLTPLCY